MLPHVSNAFKNGEINKVKEYLYTSFEFVTAIAIALTFGIAAISHTLIPLFLTGKFLPVIPLMMVESVVILLIGWSNVLGFQYLVPTGQNKAYNYSVITGAFVNIVLNVPFILFWGVMGTVFATVISELAVTGYQIYAIRNQIDIKKLFTSYYKYLISGLLMFMIVFSLNLYLETTWSMLVIEIIVGMIIYGLMLLILRPRLIQNTLAKIKK